MRFASGLCVHERKKMCSGRCVHVTFVSTAVFAPVMQDNQRWLVASFPNVQCKRNNVYPRTACTHPPARKAFLVVYSPSFMPRPQSKQRPGMVTARPTPRDLLYVSSFTSACRRTEITLISTVLTPRIDLKLITMTIATAPTVCRC